MPKISKRVLSLQPYTPGEQLDIKHGFIKINTNENAFPPSPKVKEVLDNFDYNTLRLYPPPDCNGLKEAIAQYEGVKSENVFVGNGSDEVLSFAFLTLFEESVAFSDITYSFYPVYASFYSVKQEIIKLMPNFSQDFNAFKKSKSSGIVIANPNASTGISSSVKDILSLAENKNRNVLVDEAYIEFSLNSKTLAKEAAATENLVVVKTLSKSHALAGIRCGYAIATKGIIDALEKVKNCFNSYTIDRVCLQASIAAINDVKYLKTTAQEIISLRDYLTKELKALGHTVLESDANFILVKHKSLSAKEIYNKLKAASILVRLQATERISDFIRISIGTKQEMEKVLAQF